MEREEAAQFKLWVTVAEQQMKMYDNEQLTGIYDLLKKNTKMDVYQY